MSKHTIKKDLIRAALGQRVLKSVGKSNGLTAGQVRALLGVAALRHEGLFVSGTAIAAACGLPDWQGRADVYKLIELGYLTRGKVGVGKKARVTVGLGVSGEGVVSQYERAERAEVRRFLGVG